MRLCYRVVSNLCSPKQICVHVCVPVYLCMVAECVSVCSPLCMFACVCVCRCSVSASGKSATAGCVCRLLHSKEWDGIRGSGSTECGTECDLHEERRREEQCCQTVFCLTGRHFIWFWTVCDLYSTFKLVQRSAGMLSLCLPKPQTCSHQYIFVMWGQCGTDRMLG